MWPSTSWVQICINVFAGPIFKRPMICQDLDNIRANRGLIPFQTADHGLGFVLTR